MIYPMKSTCFLLFLLSFSWAFAQQSIHGDSPAKAVYMGRPEIPPKLSVESLSFSDTDKNKRIDADESCEVSLEVINRGEGPAYGVVLALSEQQGISGLDFEAKSSIGYLKAGDRKSLRISIRGRHSIAKGEALFQFKALEANGFDAQPKALQVSTQSFLTPKMVIADHVFSAESGVMTLGEKITLTLLVQNLGEGIAKGVELRFERPENVFPNGKESFDWPILASGQSQKVSFSFFTNTRYTAASVPIQYTLTESYGQYGASGKLEVQINQSLVQTSVVKVNPQPIGSGSDIAQAQLGIEGMKADPLYGKNIFTGMPAPLPPDPDKIAVIIGNRDYRNAPEVKFAQRDAQALRSYLTRSLGFIDDPYHIIYRENASLSELQAIFGGTDGTGSADELYKLVKKDKSKVFVFFSGHGIPALNDAKPYLLPVDGNTDNLPRTAYSLDVLYQNLAQIPAAEKVVIIDACFSGTSDASGQDPQLLHQEISSVGIKGKKAQVSDDRLVVLTATQDDQVANWYLQKQQGLFTWFFLNCIQEAALHDSNKDGALTIGEIYAALADEAEGVPYIANLLRSRIQHPDLQGQNKDVVIYRYK